MEVMPVKQNDLFESLPPGLTEYTKVIHRNRKLLQHMCESPVSEAG